MPAIADQVATIEHDLAVALANLDSVKSEAAQLKTALSALQTEHTALQARHSEAVALFDETRQHAQAVATAALTMLKVSRPQAGPVAPQVNSEGYLAAQAKIAEAVGLAAEPEKADIRPDVADTYAQDQDAGAANMLASDTTDQGGFPPELQDALHADAEKLSAMTGQAHGVAFIDEPTPADRLRAHAADSDPLPIFLTPRRVPRQAADGVLG